MAAYDSYTDDAVNEQLFNKAGDSVIEREDLTDMEKLIYDAALHKFLQMQNVNYRKLSAVGVREGIYMAIAFLKVPVQQFQWVGVPLTELAARAELYRVTGEVTL